MAPKREYAGDGIIVRFEAARCIHAQHCVHELPEVFDVGARPWIQPAGAGADRVAAQVRRCPSGALTFERTDGGPQEAPPATATITEVRDGPLYVEGSITIADADGGVVTINERVALCRCGASANKPFCDNSHREAGFTTG